MGINLVNLRVLFFVLINSVLAALVSIYLPPLLAILLGVFAVISVPLASKVLFKASSFKLTHKKFITVSFLSVVIGNVVSYTQVGISNIILTQGLRVFLILCIPFILIFLKNHKGIHLVKSNWDIWFFSIWILLSAPFGLAPTLSVVYSIWFILCMFLINHFIAINQGTSRIFKVLLIAYGSLTVVSFFLSLAGIDSAQALRGSQSVWRGMFASINYFALVSTMSFALSLAALNFKNSRKVNIILYIMVIISALCSVMSFSRASVIGCLITFIVFILLSNTKLITKFTTLFLIFISGVIYNYTYGFTEILTRMSDTQNDLGQRTIIWISNINYFKSHFLNGAGITGATSIPINGKLGFSSHNSFLQFITETGVMGTFLFVVIFSRLLLDCIRIRKSNKATSTAILILLCAITINGMAESQILLPGSAFFYPFWSIVFLTRQLIFISIKKKQLN